MIVAVRRGRVSVRADGPDQEVVVLGPGERLRVVPGVRSTPAPFDAATEFAWLDGRIAFHDQPLRAVLSQVGRYYGGWIFAAGEALGGIHVSGSYRLDDPAAIVDSLAGAAKGRVLHLPGGVIVVH